jgi:Fe-S-cluster-containing dehydrogenase component/CRP-like cAMP-binding protein
LATEIRDERNRRWDEPFGDEPLDAETVSRILALPTFADVRAEDFPDWLPLDQIIANDGRLRLYQQGEVIIRKGDYGSSLFVILEGGVVGLASRATDDPVGQTTGKNRKSWIRSIAQLLARRNVPEYRPPRLRSIKTRTSADQAGEVEESNVVDLDDVMSKNPTFAMHAPQLFGELAALTRNPRGASIFAAHNDTLLFELRWQGLRDIRNWSTPFRLNIDQLYRERGLVNQLRECPIFLHVSKEALDEIAKQSLFETYGNFDWTHRFKSAIGKQKDTGHIIEQEPVICEQGHYVDGLLLINRGFARVTERVDHGVKTIGELSRNDYFGLDEIISIAQGKHGVTLSAGMRAIGYVDVIRIPTHLIIKHVLPGLPPQYRGQEAVEKVGIEEEEARQGLIDFLVDHRFINGEQAMVINLDRCIGCDDCVRACATAHNNNPRFTRHGHTHQNTMITNACMHCTDPVCLIGCPTGAIHRQETGAVVINDSTCIGCATCANSCPYNNIKMVDIRDENGDYVLDRDGQVITRATKCDLCFDQLTGPACAQACPHDALTRINVRDTKKLLTWLG